MVDWKGRWQNKWEWKPVWYFWADETKQHKLWGSGSRKLSCSSERQLLEIKVAVATHSFRKPWGHIHPRPLACGAKFQPSGGIFLFACHCSNVPVLQGLVRKWVHPTPVWPHLYSLALQRPHWQEKSDCEMQGLGEGIRSTSVFEFEEMWLFHIKAIF